MAKQRKKRPTKAERILNKARQEPSPTCHDPRQITLFDYEKRQGLAKLDAAIRVAMEGQAPLDRGRRR